MLNGRVVPYFSKTHHLGVVLIARTTGRIRIARMYAGGFNTLDFWIPPDQWCNQYPLGSVQGKSNRDNLPTISENSKALRENKDSGGALDSSFRQVHAIVQSRTQNERSGCVSYS